MGETINLINIKSIKKIRWYKVLHNYIIFQ